MVLCISNITWSDGGVDDDGNLIKPHPELEVTDGWYRLRAQVDECLARAARKGALKVGRKIAVAGAKVCGLSLGNVVCQTDSAPDSFPQSAKILRKY